MPSPARLFRSLLLLCIAMLMRLPAKAGVNVDWVTPIAPFRIADNLYYIGSRDLAAYLITTPQGSIVLNANYTTSPAQMRRSVEALGLHWRDIKVLLISHAHVDHAGGAAEILRETGAKLAVMDGDVDVMESGGATDFAFGGKDKAMQFPRAHVSRVLHDGDTVSQGGTTLTAHLTPGHTKGTTTWTMKVHLPGEPANRLRDVIIVGSWSVLDSYRLLSVHGGKPPSYPGIANDYTKTFSLLSTLPCDVFLASHGSLFDMLAKQKRMAAEGDRVWIDPQGYRETLAKAQHAFEAAYQRQSLAAEQGATR